MDELGEMSANSWRERFYGFNNSIIEIFAKQYLRQPGENDLRELFP